MKNTNTTHNLTHHFYVEAFVIFLEFVVLNEETIHGVTNSNFITEIRLPAFIFQQRIKFNHMAKGQTIPWFNNTGLYSFNDMICKGIELNISNIRHLKTWITFLTSDGRRNLQGFSWQCVLGRFRRRWRALFLDSVSRGKKPEELTLFRCYLLHLLSYLSTALEI